MNLLRTFIIAVVSGATALAFGQYTSPEIMFVTDTGDGTNSPAQVERYDPYTGAYLGAFGAGYLNTPYGVTTIGDTAYVTDLILTSVGVYYSRIDTFNWSTGAYDGTIFNPLPNQLTSLSDYSGDLILSDYGNGTGGLTQDGAIWTLNGSGGEVGETLLPAGDASRDGIVVGSQYWVAAQNVNGGNGALLSYNLNANGTMAGGPTVIDSTSSFTAVVSSIINGTTYIFAAGENDTTGAYFLNKYTTAGVLNAQYDFPVGEGSFSLAAGHNGIIYDFDGEGDVYRFDGGGSLFLGPLGEFQLPDTFQGESITVYAAPEPTSMAALAFGAFGLIARRKRQRR